jgi:mRNA interferase HigB
VRIIKETFLIAAAEQYPKAARFLEAWRATVRAAQWKNLNAVRKTYASADAVKVASGRTVVVFNVCGNDYRLIVALHYNRQIAYTLNFLTHADYSKDRWKEEL